MSWWKRLWSGDEEPASSARRQPSSDYLEGWEAEQAEDGQRVWRDSEGSILSLTEAPESNLGLPELSDEVALQEKFRRLAERQNGGLIEVRVLHESYGPTVSLIYKRLEKPAYVFTGMLCIPNQEASQVWTVVAGERGTTGMREAVVTKELFDAGKLTIEDYKRSWARDPYDPEYRGVDRSVLRFVSDDESYDDRFPGHPLTKVRRMLARVRSSVWAE